jgi:16S rRNA (guanine527-N7)-methyltransferase
MKLTRKVEEESIYLQNESICRIERFADILGEWNAVHNLTGAQTESKIMENIIDSLYPTTFLNEPDSLLDVGSGAGFPGMILAAVWPSCETVLCEPRNKRAAFLRYVAALLDMPNVAVVKKRVEEMEHAPFALISSRAVSNTGKLLEITAGVADRKTRYLFFKGSRVDDETGEIPAGRRYEIVARGYRRYLLIH